MPWSLKADGPVRYSKKEQALFRLLPKTGDRVSSRRLLKGLARKANGDMPFHARTSLVGAMRSLSDKVTANREPFRVMRSERAGPHPIEFWIEPLKK